jgi:hypothetical protein
MARPRNKVPSYNHHRQSGQARVRIGGRDIYLGPFGSPPSKELYAQLIAEHFANGESQSIVISNGEKLSIAALVVKYDDFAKSYYVKNGTPTGERYVIARLALKQNRPASRPGRRTVHLRAEKYSDHWPILRFPHRIFMTDGCKARQILTRQRFLPRL